MKKHALFMALSLALGCVSTDSLAVTQLNRVMSADDPNANPNWDWEQDRSVTIYADELNYRGINVDLPYYSPYGPATEFFTTGKEDIKSSHGWRLLKRDFGTSLNETVSMPYFILYNEVRGIVRLFFYWTRDAYSYASVGLNMSQGTAPLFNMQATPDMAYMKEGQYNSETGQNTLVKVNRGEWSVADFHLSYDAAPEINNALMFDIRGIDESDVQLNGNMSLAVLLEQRVPAVSQGGGQNPLELVFGGIGSAVSAHSDAKDQMTKQKEWVKENPKHMFADLVGGVVNSAAYTEYYPMVAGAHALYSYVNAGGGNAGDQIITTQGSIEGDINISGKITLEKPEFMLEMLQPGAVPGGSTSQAKPLFNRKLGIMAMGERPSAYYYDKRHSCTYKDGGFLGGTWTCQTTRYTKLIHTPNILLNSEIDTPLSSAEAMWGWVPNNGNTIIDYKALDENVQDFVITRELGPCSILFSSPGANPENPNEGCLPADYMPVITPPKVAAKATLELEEASNDTSVIPVTLYRQYQTFQFDAGNKEAFDQIGHFDPARVHSALDLAGGNSSIGQFATGGYTDFFAQPEIVSHGATAMQAPPLPDGRIARLETYVDAAYGGTLYFNWKVSSQAGADKLKILINGEEAKAISGEQDWHQASVYIPPGRHHVMWEYSKDNSIRAGKDTGWVDRVHFMTDPEVNFTADTYQVSPGNSVNLNWTSKDAGFCVASGSWSGVKDPNSQENTGPIHSPKTYVLDCNNWLYPENIFQKSTRVVNITLGG
ncbi:hypothetical protein SG34_004415 [Thalassomonas viridans]|uniref:Uncharacterized protein n=1 Tax=Thalassomonas viridans TaxID=137584 RepID=A0AAE9Z6V0_9GAMM|nr:hypothetical protein [Thalassomonas viridans]WDE06182.1 hypothetical protein SG34_004415 [Thalassomonas viridans]